MDATDIFMHTYMHTHTFQMVKAAVGLKITAQNLENAVAGSQLLVLGPRDDIEDLKDEVMQVDTFAGSYF